MKAGIKKRWIAALRSGESTQAIGWLRRSEKSRCCLGVLCDVVEGGGWDGHTYVDADGRRDSLFPPLGVLDAAGVACSQARHLSYLNDGRGFTFDEIADYIEVNL